MVLNSIWKEIYGMLTYFTLQLFANMTAVFCKLLFSQTSQIFRFWIIFSESYFFSSELYFSSKSYGTILYFTCITNGRYQKSFMLKNGAFFTYCRLLFFWKKKEKKKKPKSLIFFLVSTFSINAHNSSFTTSSDFQSSMIHFNLYIKQYMFMSNSKKSHKIFTRALKPKLTYSQELLLT